MCCHSIFVVGGGKTVLRFTEKCSDEIEKTITERKVYQLVEKFQSGRTGFTEETGQAI